MPGGRLGKHVEPGDMTGIEGVGQPGTPRPAARAPRSSTLAFAVPEECATDAPAATVATPAASFAPMLTLQELGGETPQDREARRHGQDMLAALADLQRTLLAGTDNMETLEKLANLAAAVPLAADRRLAGMVSAIVVRVRVELERRHVAAAPK
jgi:hypothetical protein